MKKCKSKNDLNNFKLKDKDKNENVAKKKRTEKSRKSKNDKCIELFKGFKQTNDDRLKLYYEGKKIKEMNIKKECIFKPLINSNSNSSFSSLHSSKNFLKRITDWKRNVEIK